MKLEPIDTSTTAGKARVMQMAAEGRKVAVEDVDGVFQATSKPLWNGYNDTFAIIAEPVGPDEVWVVIGPFDDSFTKESAERIAQDHIGGTVVRYRRVEE